MNIENDYLTLADASKIAPGRPSTNCIWRWCRKGVLARSGERVRLQHVRVGGRVYTKARWVDEFGARLACEDAKYFDFDGDDAGEAGTRRRRNDGRHSRTAARHRELEQVNQELDEAGL
jgi:hypothetical protein